MEWENTELSLMEEKPDDNNELDVKKEERAWEGFKTEVKDKLQDDERYATSCLSSWSRLETDSSMACSSSIDELALSTASSPHHLTTTMNKVSLKPGGANKLFLVNPTISVAHCFSQLSPLSEELSPLTRLSPLPKELSPCACLLLTRSTGSPVSGSPLDGLGNEPLESTAGVPLSGLQVINKGDIPMTQESVLEVKPPPSKSPILPDSVFRVWEKYHAPEVWDQDRKQECLHGMLPLYYAIQHPISENWDHIVDSALFLRGDLHDSHPSPDTLLEDGMWVEDTVDEDEMSLDTDSSTMSSATSPSTPELQPGDGKIYIYDGERYVALLPDPMPTLISSPTISPIPLPVPPPSLEEGQIPESTAPLEIPEPAPQLYYKKKTNKPDLWGHIDAMSWSLHAHGNPLPLQPGFDKVSAPPGHPMWCVQQGVPVVCHHFSVDFQGEKDGHPLMKWDNPYPIYLELEEETPAELNHAWQLLNMANCLVQRIVVLPEDWEGKPDTCYQKEVCYEVWKAYKA